MNKEEAISYLQQLYPYGGHCWIDEQRIEAIDMAIKSLQEKPVSEQKLSNVQRIGKNWKESVSEIDFEQELYKAFGHVKDFTLCLKIARRFYEMGRNYQEPVSEELGEIVLEGTNFNKSWYAHPELDFKAGAKWQLRKTRYEKDENNKK